MPAAYDHYNYPSYWEGRDYEHKSEIIALRTLLKKISSIEKVVDIGAGYGRLTPYYQFRAKNIYLIDPSAKLLSLARNKFSGKKYKFIQSNVENLSGKIKNKTVDLVIMIRVIHHLKDLQKAFAIISKISKKKSYFILEFPNKRHMKETLLQFIKGNLLFPLEIFPKDLSSKKSLKKGSLPFVNYHPDDVREQLIKNRFKIIESLSVSNLRYSWFKKHLTLRSSLVIEKYLQKLLSPLKFGPSIFLLARKF